MTSDERQADPITDHSVPADADFQAAGSDEAGPADQHGSADLDGDGTSS
ncbi:hypothetical protein [Planctomonas psychrotolerans]|nr:hypothetical protein [Planctomonas psychrotolerans]